jgi:hypothetical protein
MSVKVSWDLTLLPQGYAVAESETPGGANVLNSPRLAGGGFEPFMPLRPPTSDGAVQPGARTNFSDPAALLPVSGSRTTRYLVAGLDVFGRWSPWRTTSYTAQALPVQKPGLHSTRIEPSGAPSGRVQPSTLVVEFSWDWSDRSPERIRFSGNFFTGTTR